MRGNEGWIGEREGEKGVGDGRKGGGGEIREWGGGEVVRKNKNRGVFGGGVIGMSGV